MTSATGIFTAAALALELAGEAAATAEAEARELRRAKQEAARRHQRAGRAADYEEEALGDALDDVAGDEEAMFEEWEDGGEEDDGPQRRVEELSERLQRLQSLPPPCSPRRSAAMVALLFRIIALEFGQAVRRIRA